MTASRGGAMGYALPVLRTIEDGVHLVVALLLSELAVVLLIDVFDGLAIALRGPYHALDVVLSILDKTLVLLIVAELLILMGLILAMAVAILMLRRWPSPEDSHQEPRTV